MIPQREDAEQLRAIAEAHWRQIPFDAGSIGSQSVAGRRRGNVTPPTDGTRPQDDTVVARRPGMPDEEARWHENQDLAAAAMRAALAAAPGLVRAEVYQQPRQEDRASVSDVQRRRTGGETVGRARQTSVEEFRPDPTEERRKGTRYAERAADVRFEERRGTGEVQIGGSEGGDRRRQGGQRRPAKVNSDVGGYIRGGSPQPLVREPRGPQVAQKTQVGAERRGKTRKPQWFYIRPTDISPGGEVYITEKLFTRLRIEDRFRRPGDNPDHYAHMPDDLGDYCRLPVIMVDRKGLEEQFYARRMDGVVIVVRRVSQQWFDYHYEDFQVRNGRQPTDRPMGGEGPGKAPMPKKPTRSKAASVGDVSEFEDDYVKAEILEEHRTSTGMDGRNDRGSKLQSGNDNRGGGVSPLEVTIVQILAAQQQQSQKQAETQERLAIQQAASQERIARRQIKAQERLAREQMATMREIRTSPVPFSRPEGERSNAHEGAISKLPLKKFTGVGVGLYQDWEREYEIKGEAAGYDKDTLARKMVLVLENPALDAYMGLPLATRKSWTLLSAAMRKKFDPDDSYIADKNLNELMMWTNESPADFLTRVRRLARRVHPDTPDAYMGRVWKKAFINGLPYLMQQVLVQQGSSTLTVDECVAAVERCDDSLRQMKVNGPVVVNPKVVNAVSYGGSNRNQQGTSYAPAYVRPPPQRQANSNFPQSSWDSTSPRNPTAFKPSGEPGSPGNPECFNCHEFGHIARKCESERRPPPRRDDRQRQQQGSNDQWPPRNEERRPQWSNDQRPSRGDDRRTQGGGEGRPQRTDDRWAQEGDNRQQQGRGERRPQEYGDRYAEEREERRPLRNEDRQWAADKPPPNGGSTAKGFDNMGYDQVMNKNGRLTPTGGEPQTDEEREKDDGGGSSAQDGKRPMKPRATVVQVKRYFMEMNDLPQARVLVPSGTCETTEVLGGVSVSETRAEAGVGRIAHLGELPECREIAARMKAEFTKEDWDHIWVLARHYSEDTLKSTRLGFEAARLGLERRIITYQVSSKAKYFPTIDVHLGMDALVAMLRGTIMGLVAARVFELFKRRKWAEMEAGNGGELKTNVLQDMLADAVNTVAELNELAKEEQMGKLTRQPLLCDLEATDCESDESAPEDDDEEPTRKKKRVSTMAKLARCPMDAGHILEVKRRASEYIQQMTGQPFTPTVNVVQTQVEELDDDEQPPIFVRGRVGHVECLVMLDTGANVSLMSAEFVRRYFPDAKLKRMKGENSCAGYDGQKFGLEGLITCRVRVAHQSHDLQFHVSTGGKHEILLGSNWMKLVGSVAFNVAEGYVTINDGPRLPVWPRLRRQVCNVHVAGNQTVRKGFMHYLKVKPDLAGPLEQDWVFNQNDQFTHTTGLIALSTLVSGTDTDKAGFWIPVVNADRDNVRVKHNAVIGQIDYSACVLPVVNRVTRPWLHEPRETEELPHPSGSRSRAEGENEEVLTVTGQLEQPFKDRVVDREGQELVEETYYLPQGVQLHDELEEVERYQLTRLLHLKRKAFSEGDHDLGWCKMMKFHIDTGNARPIKTTPRRLRVIHQQRLRDYIQEQVKLGVIEPSKSPWSHNVVIVLKKGGPDRVCIDFRPVNEVTVKDAFPLPRIDDTLDRLTDSALYAAVDLKAGYNQIEVAEDSKEKTAFVAEGGFWQYTRMPFGLVNAPAACQRLMEMVLAGLNWEIVLIYLDDGIIFAKNFPQLLERIEIVLDRVITAGLKLSGKKCQFAMTSVKYLGHLVSAKGVQADPDTLKKITEISVPTCKKHVRSFMGLVSYYRRFGGKEFARQTYPLNQLTQKDVPFKWTEEAQKAFDWAKEMLCSKPVIQPFPDYSRPFYVCTDASAYALGAVLEQRDDEGRPMILHAASRLLTPSERTHGAVTREAEAIHFAFKKFDALIYGRHVTVLTDQKALTSWPLKELFPNDRILEMWLTMLCQYDFEIVHRAGVDNGNADALSRPPNIDEDERTGQLDLRQDIRDLIESLVDEDRLDVYQQYEIECGAVQSTLLKMSWLDEKEREGREWEKFTRRVGKEDRKAEEKAAEKSVTWAPVLEVNRTEDSGGGREDPMNDADEQDEQGVSSEIGAYYDCTEDGFDGEIQVNKVQLEPSWDSSRDLTRGEALQQLNRPRRNSWGCEVRPRRMPTGNRVGKLMRDVETGELYEISAEMLEPPTWRWRGGSEVVQKPRACSIFSKPLRTPEELMRGYERQRQQQPERAGSRGDEPRLFRDDNSRTTEVTALPDFGVPTDCEGDFWTRNEPEYHWETIPSTKEGRAKWQRVWRDRDIQPFELATEYAEHLEQIVKGVELTDNRQRQRELVKKRFLEGIPNWMQRIVRDIQSKPTMSLAAALNARQIRRDPKFEEGLSLVMKEGETSVEFARRINSWDGGGEHNKDKWDMRSPSRMYRFMAGLPEELRTKVSEDRPANYLQAMGLADKWLRREDQPWNRVLTARAGEQQRVLQSRREELFSAGGAEVGEGTPRLLNRSLRRTETPGELLHDIEELMRSAAGCGNGVTEPEREKLTTKAFWAAIPDWIKIRLPEDLDYGDPCEVRPALLTIDKILQEEDINAWVATNIHMQTGETPENFAEKLIPLVEFVATKADSVGLNEAIVRRFMAGLPGAVRGELRGVKPRTIEEAVQVVAGSRSYQNWTKAGDRVGAYCFMLTRGQKRLQAAAAEGKSGVGKVSKVAHDVTIEVAEADWEATDKSQLAFGEGEAEGRAGGQLKEAESSLDPHDYCPDCGQCDATEGAAGEDMVFCSGCSYWHHCNCVGTSREEADKLDYWYCRKCLDDRVDMEQQRVDALSAFETGEDIHAKIESEVLIRTWEKSGLAEEQRSDPEFDVIFRLRAGEIISSVEIAEEKRPQLLTADQYEVVKGLLYHKHFRKGPGRKMTVQLQLCVPQRRREEAIFSMHDSKLCGGHLGLAKVFPRLNAVYYWPTMYADAKVYIASCDKCQQRKGPPIANVVPLNPIPNVGVPLTRWVVDLMGPFGKQPTPRRNRYIVVFIDQFTKFVVARPLKDKTAKGVAEVFLQNVICEYGPPKELQSDLGSEFIALVMKELCRMLNIQQHHSTSYRPSTNGLVERFNRTLGRMLSMYVNADHRDWDLILPYVIYAYRNAVQSSTGVSPFFMVFGIEPRMLLPGDYEVDPEADVSVAEFLADRELRMRTAYQVVKRSIADTQRKQKLFHDRKARQISFKVGDSVWCYSPVVGCHRCAKFVWHWHGPFDIMEVDPNGVNYSIKRNDGKKPDPIKKVHVERLWKRTSRGQTHLEGVQICADQRHPVIAEAIYDPMDIGTGPEKAILPGGKQFEVNVVTLGAPERKYWVPGVPTFNGRGNFERWVEHLENCYRHIGHLEELGTAVTLDMFLTGAALDIFEDLTEDEQESWEMCKVAMARQLAYSNKDEFGVEVTSWSDIQHKPTTV